MKEFEAYSKLPSQNKIEVNIKKKQEIEYVLEGTLKPDKGHFIWEINRITNEIKKAEFKKTTDVLGANLPPEELIINPNCIYIPALNAKNAKKKYIQNNNQAFYYAKEPIMKLSDSF